MLAKERRTTVSGTRLYSRQQVCQPGSARVVGGAIVCRLAQRRHRVRPTAPRFRWLCRVWGRVSSNEIVLTSMLPWVSRAWGGVQKVLSARLQ